MSTATLLRGAAVADGIGGTTRRADVQTDGLAIAAVDVIDPVPSGCEVIDLAPGSVICPGFTDAHAHAEGPLLAFGRVEGALAQGVTTLVVGQDGSSWVGASAETARYLNQYFAPVNGALEPTRELGVAEYRQALSGRLSQNVAVLASQGTIRHNVAGMAPGPMDPDQRKAARAELEKALTDGAVGLSSGLDYLPSRFGDVSEIAELARPLAAADRPYVSHLRSYGPEVRVGLDELVAVGRVAGIRVHASHLWGPPAEIDLSFNAADAAGVAISYDMYSYRRSSTILAMLLLPSEVQAGGPARTLAALTDRRQRTALLADEKFSDEFLRRIVLGCLPADMAGYAGQMITQAAARTSRPAGEWVLDLLVDAGLKVGAHLDRPSLTEDTLAWLALGDRHCAGSDGIYQGQHPHPRGYSAFARLAQHYLADGPATGYQRLVRHLSASAADVYRLRNRGRLAPGMAADICVIGPDGITGHATYDSPEQIATGVSLVMVNGVITWRDGQPVTDYFPGEMIS